MVLEQSEPQYDKNGNVIKVTTRQRFHDETATGALGDPATGPQARVYYAGAYYDLADRLTDSVSVGTNGGTAWTRPSTVLARSDTALVTSYAYNAAGWVETATDPKGINHRSEYDNLGRVKKAVRHYTDGTPTDISNKTVEFSYDGIGNTRTVKALLTGGNQQTTEFVYGVTTAAGSDLNSNDILSAVRHPDPSTGQPSSGQQETYTVNALGQAKTFADRNGSTHAYAYDILGRPVSDAVTTLGSAVDGAVRRLEVAYDTQGNGYLFTSYDAASAGNVVNQVQRDFNGLGQLTKEYQNHSGAVNTGTTPKVQYAYTEMAGGANHSRLVSMTYPNGRVLNYNYSTGLNDNISRLSSLSDTSVTLESLDYLGLGTVVRRAHPQPGVDLTYVKLSGEATGDAGDQYVGTDRFGRVVDQRWLKTSTSVSTDRHQYGYDRNSNRLWRDNLVNAAFGELYAYDSLDQLSSFQRGTLNANKDGLVGLPSRNQAWNHDALGNFDSVLEEDVVLTRTHNRQNEITSIAGATTPTYDANGNLTTDQTGRTFAFDAWNRLVQAKDSGGAILVSYAYDALGRRVTKTKAGTTTDLYYSAAWQVLEEQVGGQTQVQYVWSPVYIDAMVLRDRDTNGDGTLDERLYVQQDANFNVTALIDTAGNVVERYAYLPFGGQTVYDPGYNLRAGSAYGFKHGHQGGVYEIVTGLNGFGHRWYSPSQGRWIQVDPIGFAAGDPNFYRAEENNPVRFVDPSGLGSWDPDDTYHDELTAKDRGRWMRLRALGYRIVTDDDGSSRNNFITDDNIDVEVTDELLGRPGVSGLWNNWAVDGKLIYIDADWDSSAAAFLRSAMTEIEGRHGLTPDITRRPRPGSTVGQSMNQVIPGYQDDSRVACRQATTLGYVGMAASPLSMPLIPTSVSRVGHIFRNAPGHINPATAAQRASAAKLFQRVASDPANLRADAVAVGLMTAAAEKAGVQAYTITLKNGKQVWVLVRNNEIVNAGVNAAGAVR